MLFYMFTYRINTKYPDIRNPYHTTPKIEQ